MPRIRCRALPTLRTPVSVQTPMTRISQFTPHTTSTPSFLSSRPFSSLLSTPTRFQPSQTLPTPITSSVSSLLAQKPFQARAFSASASLGVRRVTYNPSRRVQKRRHGFLSRNKAQKGRLTLTRRRMKGRKAMSW